MLELVNCAIFDDFAVCAGNSGWSAELLAPRLKHEDVLPLPVCIPSCDSVSTFPHVSGDVLFVYAASAYTDAQFDHGSRPLFQYGTLYTTTTSA